MVRVIFSPKDISFKDLLRHFWESHDPTQGSNMHLHTKNPKVALK